MLTLHPLCHKCYITFFNQVQPSRCYRMCLPFVSFSKLYGVQEHTLCKKVLFAVVAIDVLYQYSSVSMCVSVNKYAEGHAQEVLLMPWMSTEVWRPLSTQGWFGVSPNILKDLFTTNIHYFVQFIFVKWKLCATNTFERLEGNCRIVGVNTVGMATLSFFPGPRSHFSWDNPGAWKYKLWQRSCYFNASCTSHLYIYIPSSYRLYFFNLKPILE